MSEKKLITVHGFGSHGRTVINAALLCGWQVLTTDDKHNTKPDGESSYICGIGNNATRKRFDGKGLTKIIHPTAHIERSVRIGQGTFVGPMAMIHVAAKIGRGVIINSGAIVEHDDVVDDWAHIAPNTTLCGGVHVGEGALVGAGAVVKPNIRIGKWSVIGCGAVVIRNVPDGETWAGNPARRIDIKEKTR